jgi:hypothetical protein
MAGPWMALDPGLELGRFDAPAPEGSGDGSVQVVRVDPSRYRLRLLNASSPGEGEPRTAREWADRHQLAAAINAGMYQEDRKTGVALMVTRGHTNNPRLSKDRSVLAFDLLQGAFPDVQIIDRDCQDFDRLRSKYATLIQGIRMVACDRRNVWSPQPRRSSIACVATDAEGRILLIHSRAARSTYDFIQILLDLPLDVRRAMYLEGGSEAQLFVRGAGIEREFVGGFDGGLLVPGAASRAWKIPNVIGIETRPLRP